MPNVYEKHQRDYTLIGTSIIGNCFYNSKMADFFSYNCGSLYVLIEDGILYHFFNKKDYGGWAKAYFKKYSKDDFLKFAEEQKKLLDNFNKFFNKEVENNFDYLKKINQYMRDFMAIVMISPYAPDYIKDLDPEILEYCIYFRKKTEDVHKNCMSIQKKIFTKIEKERNLPPRSIEYLLEDEYDNFVKTGQLSKGIEKRKKFFFVKISKDGDNIYSREEAEKKLDELDKTRDMDFDVDEIKGNIAFKGKVQGKVVKIQNIEEADKVGEGDIIVTSMTDPRYLPAMKKAVAFVTDEGGMLCHAAIVAREMKKPCIIGTKIATKVLKDGDEVEVDAERGVVKILNKKLK